MLRLISRELNYTRAKRDGMRGLAAVANAKGNPEKALLDAGTCERPCSVRRRTRGCMPRSCWRAESRCIQLNRLSASAEALEEAVNVFQHADLSSSARDVRGARVPVLADIGNSREAYDDARIAKEMLSRRQFRNQIDQRFTTLRWSSIPRQGEGKRAAGARERNEPEGAGAGQTARQLQATVIR